MGTLPEPFPSVRQKAEEWNLISGEHFAVDGTLLEAWASLKSFQRKAVKALAPPDDPAMRR